MLSSALLNLLKTVSKLSHGHNITIIVWTLRLIIGAVFIYSGVSKAIDPWGFVIKLQEYLSVWHLLVPREAVVAFAVVLSATEFISGVFLLLGALKRTVVWIMSAMMLFMLPLTIYIAIANPIEDCGCFGDALILSNTATAIKNIIIVAALVVLWRYNSTVKGLVYKSVQWMLILVSIAYCLVLSLTGYNVQPLVDFRPFKTGTSILGANDSQDTGVTFIYEKDGEMRAFGVDELPDSTWVYVGRKDTGESGAKSISFYKGDENVAEYEIESGTPTPTLLLLVPNPRIHEVSRSHQANRLSRYIQFYGGKFMAIVATHPDSVDTWATRASCNYPVYSGEDTMLKEIARGDAALVYLHGDTIKWKRSLYSFSPEFPEKPSKKINILDKIRANDTNTLFMFISLGYVLLVILIIMIGRIFPGWDRKNE